MYTKRKKHGDVPDNDGDVFDFFNVTGNGVKFKKFLTPITESNMLLYIKLSRLKGKNIDPSKIILLL